MQSVQAQYCLPSFSIACTSDDFIDNFSTTGGVTNISNLATGCNGAAPNNYTFFSTMQVAQIQGFSFNFTVQAGQIFGQGHRIWIDWNQDLDFADPGEDVYVSPGSTTAAYNGTITVPITAVPGNTRMRVLCRYATIPAVTDYCGTGFSFGECEDYIMNVIPATPCSGTPVAGSVSPGNMTLCAGQVANLGLTGAGLAGNMTYQWQQSLNGGLSWTNAAGGFGATSPGYQTPNLTATIMYRMYIICNNSGLSDTTAPITITVSGPTYATLPYAQDFENWVNFCNTNDVPDDYHWSNNPLSGNNSWRREDQGGSGSWLVPTAGMYYPSSSTGAHSARFHSYYTNLTGDIDLFVDCSQQIGPKTLFFDYINDNSAGWGYDYLETLLSTDGGATYTPLGTFNNSTTWQNFSLAINSNSPTTIIRFKGHGDYQYDTDLGIDNIMVLSPCVGAPNAGAIANVTPCANVPFNLSLTGNTLAGGLIYTWESAPSATGPWTLVNITAGPVVNTQIAAPTYFRCYVNCPASGLTDTTAPMLINLASFYFCYCQSQPQNLVYMQNVGNVTVYDAQNNILLNNGNASPLLNNTSPIYLYSNYTNLTPTDIYPDSTYSLSETCFAQVSYFYNGYSKVFIDFNRDGSYDPNTELVAGGAVNSPNQQMSGTFTVPSNAQFGLTGMRVIYEIFGSSTSINPCGFYGYGETEDYLMNISLPPCNTPPNAGTATISDTITCPGYTVFLEDTTHDVMFNGLTFNWQYSSDGITFSDVLGATADTLTFTVNSATWFRFRTTCNGNVSDYSNVVHVMMSPPYACYGNSQAVGGILDTSDIGAFIISDPGTNNNIFSFITGGPHLLNAMAVKKRTDYTGNTLDLYADSTYKLSIYHIMKYGVHADAKVTVFIDYNNNQLYDIPAERVFTGLADVNNFYLIGEITTPASPALNVGTGMRVILNNDTAPNAASDNGVGVYTSGETEDYLVKFKLKPVYPAGIENLNVLESIGIYPNPSTGKVYVGFNAAERCHVSIQVLNIAGSALFNKNCGAVTGEFVTELDLSGLSRGTYLVKISTDKGSFVRRLIIE
ncbi:MAG: T9SS type A sorting domain-containing protein [Chitinophagaceae bacterium]|nr:T9SS type A sorting domain-containing protein [Chitinophagaceae bacterium]